MKRTIVDFHSHILPGIDDGSKSLEQSVAMLKMEREQGIECVVATPHFYAQHDTPGDFLKRRAEAEEILRAEMARFGDLPKLAVGAEVYYFHGISDSEMLPKLTVGDIGYVLVEMPMPPWSSRMYRELEEIRGKQGLVPVVAHIDRYISPLRTYQIPQKLEELPVLVQANASFFLRGSTKRMAQRMLREGRIHLLGSDCHNLSDRAPNLGEAVRSIGQSLGPEAIAYICRCQDEVFGGGDI